MFRFDRVSLVLLLLGGCATHSEIDAGEKLDGALDDGAADADAADDASDADAEHEDAQTPDPRHPITPCGSALLRLQPHLEPHPKTLLPPESYFA